MTKSAHLGSTQLALASYLTLGEVGDSYGIILFDSPFSLNDDYLFWIRQIGDQGLFVHLSLNLDALLALDREDLWSKGLTFYNDSITMLTQIWTTDESGASVLELDLGSTSTWLNRFRTWLLDVETLTHHQWIGFVYPSQVRSYIDHVDYVMARLNGMMKPEVEITKWRDWARDHALLTAKLLSESQEPLSSDLNQVAAQLQSLTGIGSAEHIAEVNERLIEILTTVLEFTVNRSNTGPIHPMFVTHMLRESNRAQAWLTQASG